MPPRLDGQRVDRVVAELAGLSRSSVQGLIDSQHVTIAGSAPRPARRVNAGEAIEVAMPDPTHPLEPEEIEFSVPYVDSDVVVVDKPAGLVVHPGAGRERITLAAGLLHRWPDLEGVGDPDRWGIVHRLDRETSGLLIVARTPFALTRLREALASRQITRIYDALVHGKLQAPTGTIDAPVARDPYNRAKRKVTAGGKQARSHYRVTAAWAKDGVSRADVSLETGRTHQIRVHMATIGNPVVGDAVYGTRTDEPWDPGRVWLHARQVRFRHPRTQMKVKVDSPLPDDLSGSLLRLGPPD